MPCLAQEIADFIAAGCNSLDVIKFQCSVETRNRIADLIQREKSGGLSVDEFSELTNGLEYEHLMRLAKARACENLSAF